MSESDGGGAGGGGHAYRDDVMDLETFVGKLIHRLCQYIVQSRQGELTKAKSDPNATRQVWFSVAVKELNEISEQSTRALNNLNRNQQQELQRLSADNMVPNPLLHYFPFSIEISLKTAEGDTMVLENWVLSLKDAPDPVTRRPARFNSNDIYYRLGVMIKSVLIIARSLPAYKLSRRQGPETFVVMYRPFLGECSESVLGEGFQSYQVSSIPTPAGTICLRVDYRTSMTIAPTEPYFVSAASSGASSNSNTAVDASTQPIMMVKSDHFHFHEKPRTRGMRSGDESSEQTVTSDESQEAMRLFMTSPPDPNRGAALMEDNYGRKHSSDDSDSFYEKLKLGAFASKGSLPSPGVAAPAVTSGLTSVPGAGGGGIGGMSDSNDPLMQLFAPKTNKDEEERSKDKSSTARSPSEQSDDGGGGGDGDSSKEDLEKALEDLRLKEEKSEFEFVDFKTPFSLQAKMESGPQDLTNFFEETRKAKERPVLLGGSTAETGISPSSFAAGASSVTGGGGNALEDQLDNLDLQLQSFESNLVEYDEMLKTLETASESESDYCVS